MSAINFLGGEVMTLSSNEDVQLMRGAFINVADKISFNYESTLITHGREQYGDSMGNGRFSLKDPD